MGVGRPRPLRRQLAKTTAVAEDPTEIVALPFSVMASQDVIDGALRVVPHSPYVPKARDVVGIAAGTLDRPNSARRAQTRLLLCVRVSFISRHTILKTAITVRRL